MMEKERKRERERKREGEKPCFSCIFRPSHVTRESVWGSFFYKSSAISKINMVVLASGTFLKAGRMRRHSSLFV